ncbi:MAG TPA: hypothetical protein VGP08_24180 [Pyrinomonadaceae bacterium]|jgi:hypothetical protein|nr:hypothetical protein [Pyrinomonadaceae bacterium]
MSIVAVMAIFGVRAGRATVGLNNSARDFAQNAEKARLDAIRRRTTTHVEFTGPNTYEVTMDFTGDGNGETRSFKLDDGVVLTDANGAAVSANADNLPWADFDWRGRTYECNALFNLKNARNEKLAVQIAGSGDITVNSSVSGLPNVNYSNVNKTADVNPTATLSGSDTKVNLSPCSTISATPTPTPTPEATPEDPPCSLTPSPAEITDLKRKGGGTATLSVTVNQPGTIDKTVNPNLTATTASSETITSSGGATIGYTVKSGNNSTGKFPIQFAYSNCNPVTVYVTVVK